MDYYRRRSQRPQFSPLSSASESLGLADREECQRYSENSQEDRIVVGYEPIAAVINTGAISRDDDDGLRGDYEGDTFLQRLPEDIRVVFERKWQTLSLHFSLPL